MSNENRKKEKKITLKDFSGSKTHVVNARKTQLKEKFFPMKKFISKANIGHYTRRGE